MGFTTISFDFVGFTVNLFVCIQFFKELNSELPIISRSTTFLAVRNKQVSSASSLVWSNGTFVKSDDTSKLTSL